MTGELAIGSPQIAPSEDYVPHRAARGVLEATRHFALRKLRCEVRDGVVFLHGVVGSFYLKQLAQTAILQLRQVQGVRNLVEVQRPPAHRENSDNLALCVSA